MQDKVHGGLTLAVTRQVQRIGPVSTKNKRRCAIDTRKSTEEGLDQVFNNLDAQREACAAYVLSQCHEGWELVPDF